ncbi:MAG: class I SAM-dependent methyltransferase [Bacteroidetes bacterium]|nr:MAG: class I SAM-dependent methyltransferase [Bacteroidota bacterium]
MNKDIITYYSARAKEYERIYTKPERQRDLQRLTGILQDLFRGQSVLEIACGTGWWTQRLSQTTSRILATDLSASMLEVARAKDYGTAAVSFLQEDAFQPSHQAQFDGLFSGFLWSHIPNAQLDEFLERCLERIRSGGTVAFLDNRFVPDSSTPIHETDADGNSYQLRHLEDGSKHLVLKNFPSAVSLKNILENCGASTEVLQLEYYWLAICRAR